MPDIVSHISTLLAFFIGVVFGVSLTFTKDEDFGIRVFTILICVLMGIGTCFMLDIIHASLVKLF